MFLLATAIQPLPLKHPSAQLKHFTACREL